MATKTGTHTETHPTPRTTRRKRLSGDEITVVNTPERKAKPPVGAQDADYAQAAEYSGARPPSYNFAAFEAHWRERWEADGIYRVDLRAAKRPYYNLMMFPYPSAEGLHVGNMYAFVGSDIHGRWMSMRGYDVFEPMGFDAFGIHSENFAIKQGKHPRALTAQNVRRFREEQLKRIGNRFDWSHEVNTTDPAYYRWTQWIFIQLFKAGLAERTTGVVNWCPKDKTVLADEQVINGRCERCGSIVERRAMPHWSLLITRYADRLLNNLDALDWSYRVIAAQRNWIGRSQGLEFDLPIAGKPDASVRVFTTRPDTIFGMTFVVLAPEHPLVEHLTAPARRKAVAAYRAEAVARASAARSAGNAAEAPQPTTGVFTGAYAIHPLTGERIPIWVADYVLMEYGAGAIMAVPAHDERDLTFARMMGLPVRAVVIPTGAQADEDVITDQAFTGQGVLAHADQFTGMSSEQAQEAISAWFEQRDQGRRVAHYHLRDWLISRQRYWGPPIPIIYCPEHGAVPVPEDQLPVLLPETEDYLPTASGDSPLARIESFVHTTCPICGQPAKRETDVSDNFLDSAWYFLRYPSNNDERAPWDADLTRKWLPVNMYIGGPEHSVLHLLYARFITMAMRDLGFLPFEEPFTHFRAHGMITKDGEKISKSKGNVINPDGYITRYGADVFRVYLMFMGPYQGGGDFTDRGMGGVVRFLERVWELANRVANDPSGAAGALTPERAYALRETIERVTTDIPALKYNTAIASLMGYLNTLEAQPEVAQAEMQAFLKLLAPFAPYVTEELWARMGSDGLIHTQPWPEADVSAQPPTITLVAQVDGRVRDRFEAPVGLSEAEARERALASERVQRALGDASVKRVVYAPDRLINLVTK
ncbi:MAG TPA: leucine--tRNA ligase [Ktedonobacterales bacterium]|nr:leucine--tRNA ligase [Ktedonobacterales bacterium]